MQHRTVQSDLFGSPTDGRGNQRRMGEEYVKNCRIPYLVDGEGADRLEGLGRVRSH